MKTDSKATTSNESCSGSVASTSVTGPTKRVSRRGFIQSVSVATAALGLPRAYAQQKPIAGLEKAAKDANASKGWKPVSDRKIRFGIVGYGLCQFGAAFSFQDHPNVEIVADKIATSSCYVAIKTRIGPRARIAIEKVIKAVGAACKPIPAVAAV